MALRALYIALVHRTPQPAPPHTHSYHSALHPRDDAESLIQIKTTINVEHRRCSDSFTTQLLIRTKRLKREEPERVQQYL
jgi:hypothetical protein